LNHHKYYNYDKEKRSCHSKYYDQSMITIPHCPIENVSCNIYESSHYQKYPIERFIMGQEIDKNEDIHFSIDNKEGFKNRIQSTLKVEDYENLNTDKTFTSYNDIDNKFDHRVDTRMDEPVFAPT